MAIGMSYEQYWYGDVWVSKSFVEADKLRQERVDTEAWQFGVYVAKAIESTICNAFLDKGKEPMQYPQQPLFVKPKEEKQIDEDLEIALAESYMSQMVRAGKKWGKH